MCVYACVLYSYLYNMCIHLFIALTYYIHLYTIHLQVHTYLKDHDLSGLDIQIMSPVHAMRYTCKSDSYII